MKIFIYFSVIGTILVALVFSLFFENILIVMLLTLIVWIAMLIPEFLLFIHKREKLIQELEELGLIQKHFFIEGLKAQKLMQGTGGIYKDNFVVITPLIGMILINISDKNYFLQQEKIIKKMSKDLNKKVESIAEFNGLKGKFVDKIKLDKLEIITYENLRVIKTDEIWKIKSIQEIIKKFSK